MATAEEENILKCAICFELLTDPKVLQCRHAFCKDCISRHYKENNKNCAPCPMCRREYFPPSRKPECLPDCSIPLSQLLQVRKKTDQKCESESCREDSGVFICLKCRKWLCHACRELVCSNKFDDPISNQNHDAHREYEIPPDLFRIVEQSRHKACGEHKEYDMKWFCPKCKKLVCRMCRTYTHLHHDIIDVQDQATEYCNVLKTKIQKLKEKERENEVISQTFRNLLLKFYSKMSETATSKWQNSMERCQENALECEHLVHFITHLILYGSFEVIVDKYLNVEKQVDNILSKSSCNLLNSERMFAKEYLEHLPEIDQNSADVGSIRTLCQKNKDVSKSHRQLFVPEERHEDEIIYSRTAKRQMSTDQSKATHQTTKDNGGMVLVCQGPGCQNGIAFCVCKICKKWLCNSCREQNCNETEKHDADPLEGLSSFLCDMIEMGRNDICAIHPNVQETYFCNTCKTLTCDDCKNNQHEGHNTCSVEECAMKFRSILTDKRNNLKKKQQSLKKAKNEIQGLHETSGRNVLNPTFVGGTLDSCESSIENCTVMEAKITDLLHYANDRCVVIAFAEVDNSTNDCMNTAPSACLQNSQERINQTYTTFNNIMESLEQSARSPNTSEEGNAAAHISWFKSLCDFVKWIVSEIRNFISGSG